MRPSLLPGRPADRSPSDASRLPWRVQIVAFLALLLAAVLAVAVAASVLVARGSAQDHAADRALAIARTTAADPRFAGWVGGRPDPDGPAQAAAETIRARTGALYVVVTDDRGVRFSHPRPENIGQTVSTDPSAPLAGQEYTGIERGTLGSSARGKVPLRDASGSVVGTVSVGVAIAEVDATWRRLAAFLITVGALALTAGIAALIVFWRRLKEATHGLEPEEMADLLREHAAVLGALDGVLATDAGGRVRVCNDAARRCLGADVRLGSPAGAAGLPEPIAALLAEPHRGVPASGPAEPLGRLVVAEGRVLDVRRFPVARDGRDLGSVLTLRDRTDLDDLGRELEVTRALTDALRAQAHEHANRLHALSGLLHQGDSGEARAYVAELAEATAWRGAVADPYLAGLLGGKVAAASEAGVELRVSEATWLPVRLDRPLDTITVVGNLVDNAVRAAAEGERRPAWVEVTLLADGPDLLVHVVDSGPGIPAGGEDRIFVQGFTTKSRERDGADAAGHGLGLPLARVTARRHGGDVTLAAARGEGHGAAFRARLAGVASETEEDR